MVFLPLYLVVMNWVSPFGFCYYWIEYFYGFITHDVCLAWDTRGDNEVFYWFTWCMFWHSTRGFPRWHWGNLCMGVDAHFRPCFSSRNLKLFDAYRIIDPRILVVTLEYLGDIRVDWCVSYGVILLRTLGLFVTLIGIAQWIDRKE